MCALGLSQSKTERKLKNKLAARGGMGMNGLNYTDFAFAGNIWKLE